MTLEAKKPRMKTCKICKTEFSPRNSLQKACSVPCAMEVVKADKAKEVRTVERKERAERIDARRRLKTKSEHLRETQAVFNEFIRLRDRDQPCISCGRSDGEVRAQAVGGTWDCGHYRSVGSSPELRYEPLNTARQCKQCNRDKSGNIVLFRVNLIQRIGLEMVEWLEGPHEPKRYTIDELKAIKAEYRAKVRDLKRGME